MVVIAADHGESLGEHNKLQHGVSLYQTEVRVPLIVRVPGQTKGTREKRIVHLADIMPSILAQFELDVPKEIQGTSLEQNERSYPVISSLGKPRGDKVKTLDAIYEWPWKLIVPPEGNAELYNIEDDPNELDDLSPKLPSTVRSLKQELDTYAQTVSALYATSPSPQDQETFERLRALGYVE